jgi:hypothetical protein
VIGPPGQIRAFVASKPVNFGKGIDDLAALVKEQLRGDLYWAAIYVFRDQTSKDHLNSHLDERPPCGHRRPPQRRGSATAVAINQWEDVIPAERVGSAASPLGLSNLQK